MAGKKKKKKASNTGWIILFLLLLAAGGFYAWITYRFPVKGIDVSHHQKNINWNKVAEAGYTFAFIKATEGAQMVDEDFEQNWEGAGAAGLTRGAYHYFLPSVDAESQAKNFLKTASMQKGDLPPVLDLEETSGKSPAEILAGAKKWLALVEKETGVKPVVYTMSSFISTQLKAGLKEYPLWIASLGLINPRFPDSWKDWTFWQYSHSGKVEGIAGKVDKNYFNGSKKEFEKLLIK